MSWRFLFQCSLHISSMHHVNQVLVRVCQGLSADSTAELSNIIIRPQGEGMGYTGTILALQLS